MKFDIRYIFQVIAHISMNMIDFELYFRLSFYTLDSLSETTLFVMSFILNDQNIYYGIISLENMWHVFVSNSTC